MPNPPLTPLTFTLLLTLLTTLTIFTHPVSSRCCFPDGDTRCADGNTVVGWCCGHGSCNIFCCNCDGGCLGNPKTTKPSGGVTRSGSDSNTDNVNGLQVGGAAQYAVCTASSGSSIFSGDEDCGAQLFRALDVEGTGTLSVDQYLGWYRGVGAGAAGAGRSSGTTGGYGEEDEYLIGAREYFLRFDANGDGFVDETEMHRAVGP